MNLKFFREAMLVKRFHTETVIREDTIGHHSANVAGIILWLYYPEIPSGNLLAAAILHDAAERVTGDIPAPTKWRYRDVKKMMDGIESNVHYENDLHHHDLIVSNDELAALKFADGMELALKCAHEVLLGNTTVKDVVTRISDNVEEYLKSHPLDSRFRAKAEQLITSVRQSAGVL